MDDVIVSHAIAKNAYVLSGNKCFYEYKEL
jgi:hypothetical protein